MSQNKIVLLGLIFSTQDVLSQLNLENFENKSNYLNTNVFEVDSSARSSEYNIGSSISGQQQDTLIKILKKHDNWMTWIG